jgi:DNA repair protein RecO (recombination protein O)
MGRPRFQKTQGIVLKNLPLGEADRILTLYTPHHGKVRAVAKGVRRVKSHLGGHLEPLMCSEVLITKGRGSLDVISQAETVSSHVRLRSDLWRTTCGIYATELIDQFGGEGLENLGLYTLLRDTLARLSEEPNPALSLRYFEMHLLILAGFQPELYSCLSCNVTLSPVTNFFSPLLGGVLCPACRRSDSLARPLSLNALKVLRLLARGSFETASKVRLESDLALEVEHTLRQYIRHLLEKDLKSTGFLDILRREESDAPAFTPSR